MTTTYDLPRPNYVSQPSASSNTSRYIPDGYPIPSPARQQPSNDYLAPPGPPQQMRPQSEPLAYQPIAPEQYRPTPDTRGIPPAQLPPNGPNTAYVDADGYGTRPQSYRRYGSTDSRLSHRSHASSRSHHSHTSDRRRRDRSRETRRDHDRGRVGDREQHHHRKRSSDRDSLHDAPLKRKDTHRPGYGGSLFALGSWVKSAWKGA